MYAHQVIDSLEHFIKYFDKKNSFKIEIKKIISAIKRSQKFHLKDEIDNVAKIIKTETDLPFCGELAKHINLPYPICWFDFELDQKKFGAVVMDSTENDIVVFKREPSDISIFCFSWDSEGKKWIPLKLFYNVFRDESSKTLSIGIAKSELLKSYAKDNNKNITQEIEDETNTKGICYLIMINYFLKLINCKNITTETNPPDEKLNKKRKLLKKQPIFTYKTLVLKPTGKFQETIPKHLWENRIHLCRGHFKTYTEEKPLFGRITGSFWWQPCVKGRNKSGIVLKDYEVINN